MSDVLCLLSVLSSHYSCSSGLPYSLALCHWHYRWCLFAWNSWWESSQQVSQEETRVQRQGPQLLLTWLIMCIRKRANSLWLIIRQFLNCPLPSQPLGLSQATLHLRPQTLIFLPIPALFLSHCSYPLNDRPFMGFSLVFSFLFLMTRTLNTSPNTSPVCADLGFSFKYRLFTLSGEIWCVCVCVYEREREESPATYTFSNKNIKKAVLVKEHTWRDHGHGPRCGDWLWGGTG